MQAYNYGIGFNETVGNYISKQDMIDYHMYKSQVFSDEGKQWHLDMAATIENNGIDDFPEETFDDGFFG